MTMNATALPPDAEPAAVVADFERRARRVETPCGDGTMVWRAWGEGPPLLLFHGSHGSWSHWIRNIDALSQGRTVWAADLPGYGEAADAPAGGWEPYAAILAEGLAWIIPDAGPVDILGFSFGGVAGAYLSVLHPQSVKGLVLVGTGGLDTPVGHVNLRGVRRHEGEARRAAHRDNLLGLMLHNPESADDLAVHLQELNGLRGRLNPAALVLPDRLVQALAKMPAKVAGIWGEHDRPHPEPALQEAVLRRFQPDAPFVVIPEAGHWAMYERPEAFNAAALEILG
jgi:pimeloyl-ACP methyl ester carboxylesterase